MADERGLYDPQLAMHDIVRRHLARAGADASQAGPIAEALLAGRETPESQAFLNAMTIGNPDYTPDEQALAGETFGKKNSELRDLMLKDYQGRGWSQQEIWKLGRMPNPRELSEGSRQHWDWSNDSRFLDEYQQAHKKHLANPKDRAADGFKRGAAAEWQRVRGLVDSKALGESGWMGALTNSAEYTAGTANNRFLSPMANALMYQTRGERQPQGDNLWSPLRVVSKYNNEAQDYQDIQEAANKVSPLLPGYPEGWKAKDEAYKKYKQLEADASPVSYDDHYRYWNGHYPSYFGSGVREFVENFPDPMSAMSLGLGGFSKALFKGTAKQFAKAGTRAVIQEGSEEIPSYAALTVPLTAGPHIAQNNLPDEQRTIGKLPSMAGLFWPSNEARTDKYVKDPATGQWGPESQAAFEERHKKRLAAQTRAFQEWEQLQSQMPSLYPSAKQPSRADFFGGLQMPVAK